MRGEARQEESYTTGGVRTEEQGGESEVTTNRRKKTKIRQRKSRQGAIKRVLEEPSYRPSEPTLVK